MRRRLIRLWPLWFVFVLLGVIEGLFFNFGPFVATQMNVQFTWSIASQGSSGPADRTILTGIFAIITGGLFLLWTNSRYEDSVIPGGYSIQGTVFNYLGYCLIRRIQIRTISIVILFLGIASFVSSRIFTEESNLLVRFLDYGFISNFIWFLLGFFSLEILRAYKSFDFSLQSLKLLKSQQITWLITLVFILPFLNAPRGNNFETMIMGLFVIFIGRKLLLKKSIRHFLGAIGRVSYFIYFFHFQILFLVIHYLSSKRGFFDIFDSKYYELNFLLVFSLLFTFVVAVSYVGGRLSWRYFENPLVSKYK